MDKSFIYYHNPRCSKSREGLKILEKNTENVKVKLYLSDAISFSDYKGYD
jgi:arsenate reductase-like glutaredoxin family protein